MATRLIRRPTPTASTRRMLLALPLALLRPQANLRIHPLRQHLNPITGILATHHTLRRHTECHRLPRALGRVRAGLIMLITRPLILQVKTTLTALTAQGLTPPQRITGHTPRHPPERSGRPALPKRRLNLKYVTERRASPQRQGRRGPHRWVWTLARCGPLLRSPVPSYSLATWVRTLVIRTLWHHTRGHNLPHTSQQLPTLDHPTGDYGAYGASGRFWYAVIRVCKSSSRT